MLPLTAPVCLGLSRSWCFFCFSFWKRSLPSVAFFPTAQRLLPMECRVPFPRQRVAVRSAAVSVGGGVSSARLAGEHTHFGSPLQCKQQVLVLASSEGASSGVCSPLCCLMPTPALSHASGALPQPLCFSPCFLHTLKLLLAWDPLSVLGV